MRSIRFSDQVSEEDQMQLRDLSAYNHRRQSDYRINSLPRIKKHHTSGGSGMRTSTSSYGSLHRRPLSALARSHALEDGESIDDYVSHAKSSRVRSGNHGPRLTHSRPSLSAMRTTSLDDSQADSQGYYLPPTIRPASRARSGFSASRTGSVDGTGVDRLSYQFPANHSLALDPLDTYHHTQPFHGSRSGACWDKQSVWPFIKI